MFPEGKGVVSLTVAFLWEQCSWLYKAEEKEDTVIRPELLKFIFIIHIAQKKSK